MVGVGFTHIASANITLAAFFFEETGCTQFSYPAHLFPDFPPSAVQIFLIFLISVFQKTAAVPVVEVRYYLSLHIRTRRC